MEEAINKIAEELSTAVDKHVRETWFLSKSEDVYRLFGKVNADPVRIRTADYESGTLLVTAIRQTDQTYLVVCKHHPIGWNMVLYPHRRPHGTTVELYETANFMGLVYTLYGWLGKTNER